MQISWEEYRKHCNDYDGFCVNCEKFTVGGVEPDAHNYQCEECGCNTVCGTEEAMVTGRIELTDREERS